MKKMENNNLWIWIAAILGVIAGGWLLKRLIPLPPGDIIDRPIGPIGGIEEEYADGEIAFDDIVGYFKSLNLKREDGKCSIVSDKNEKFHKRLFKTDYTSLGLFVMNEEKGIVKGKIIHAKSFDAKTLEVLGGHDVIILT